MGKNSLRKAIFYAIGAFLAFPGMVGAEYYIPLPSERKVFVFSNQGETQSVGVGKVFVLSDVFCGNASANGQAELADGLGNGIRVPTFTTASALQVIPQEDQYVFTGTLTYSRTANVTCYYNGKSVDSVKWEEYAYGVNRRNAMTPTKWMQEFANSEMIAPFLTYWITIFFVYVLLPFGSAYLGLRYGMYFFRPWKDGK